MIPQGDKLILRELAKLHVELNHQDVNKERIARIRNTNGLVPVRPIVWIEEIPWQQMNIDGLLTHTCESEEARKIENHFRRILLRWQYFQADMVVEDAYYIPKAVSDTGTGAQIREDTLSAGDNSHILSHHYEDQLDTEEKVDVLRLPIIKARPETDKKNLEIAEDIFGGVIPVRLRGHGIYYAPWDEISMLRGVEPILIDMMERPEFLHKTIEKFTAIGLARYEQMEAEGLLDYNSQSLHCTPPHSNELPASDYDGSKVRLKDIWFRGMAQIFSTVSPAMHDEFDLQYMRRLMDKCGLSYYGCCEPLNRMIPYLKKIPNMRKIGVSPWADIRSCTEQIGRDYVVASKPNPAFVAINFNADTVRKEIAEIIEACLAHGCPYEFVLKDISTVSNKPQNIIYWNKTVQETIDHYYN